MNPKLRQRAKTSIACHNLRISQVSPNATECTQCNLNYPLDDR